MALVWAVVALHLGFLAYVVGGGFLAWWWPRTLVAHVAAVAWGLASVTVGLDCPLTGLESALRRRAGAPPLPPGGFIDHYLGALERYTPAILTTAAAVVAVSWAGVALRYRRPSPGDLSRSG
jgi:hypothetical protein